jgi:hypothetical protein
MVHQWEVFGLSVINPRRLKMLNRGETMTIRRQHRGGAYGGCVAAVMAEM